MMRCFERALAYDIHVRRDLDEKFPAKGVRILAKDIGQGVVYESNGVKVTAFLVDPALVRQNYDGPVEFGEDVMTIDVGEEITVHRYGGAHR